MLKMLVCVYGKMRFSFFCPFSSFDFPTTDKSVVIYHNTKHSVMC